MMSKWIKKEKLGFQKFSLLSSFPVFCLSFWDVLSSLRKACVCACVYLCVIKPVSKMCRVVVKHLLSSVYREAQGQKLNNSAS